jgi:hypothetical protein
MAQRQNYLYKIFGSQISGLGTLVKIIASKQPGRNFPGMANRARLPIQNFRSAIILAGEPGQINRRETAGAEFSGYGKRCKITHTKFSVSYYLGWGPWSK